MITSFTHKAGCLMILIVDDDETYATGLKKLLEYQGYNDVVIETNASDGLNSIVEKPPGLIILDIMMPIGDNSVLVIGNPDGHSSGLALLKQMKRLDISLDNVLIISVRWEEDFHKELRSLGLKQENILTKPVSAVDVINNVKRLVQSR